MSRQAYAFLKHNLHVFRHLFDANCLKKCVIPCQSLSVECEPSRTPEMGMDREEPQVFPILRALHEGWRAGFLPHWEDQVSQLLPAGIYGGSLAKALTPYGCKQIGVLACLHYRNMQDMTLLYHITSVMMWNCVFHHNLDFYDFIKTS